MLLGDAGSARASIEVMQRGPEGQAQPRTFQVAGSPYTPKYYGSFQLQDEQHAGAWLPTPLHVIVSVGSYDRLCLALDAASSMDRGTLSMEASGVE